MRTTDRRFWASRLCVVLFLLGCVALLTLMLWLVVDLSDKYGVGFATGLQWAVVCVLVSSPLLSRAFARREGLFLPMPWDVRAGRSSDAMGKAAASPKALRWAKMVRRFSLGVAALIAAMSAFEAWLAVDKDPPLAVVGMLVGFGAMAAFCVAELLLFVATASVGRWVLRPA